LEEIEITEIATSASTLLALTLDFADCVNYNIHATLKLMNQYYHRLTTPPATSPAHADPLTSRNVNTETKLDVCLHQTSSQLENITTKYKTDIISNDYQSTDTHLKVAIKVLSLV